MNKQEMAAVDVQAERFVKALIAYLWKELVKPLLVGCLLVSGGFCFGVLATGLWLGG